MTLGRKSALTGEALLAALGEACSGLVYISECDAAIAPVMVGNGRSLTLKQLIERTSPGQAVETIPAADFFERLTTERRWHDEAARERIRRFRHLAGILFENTENPQMFRIGRIRIQIFVLGYDSDGNIAGIRTEAVET